MTTTNERARDLLSFLLEKGTFIGTHPDLEAALGWRPYTLASVLSHVRTHPDRYGMTIAPVRKGPGVKVWFPISTDGSVLDEVTKKALEEGKLSNGRDIRTRALGIFHLAKIEELQHDKRTRKGKLAYDLRVQAEALLLHAENYVGGTTK